MAKVYQIYKLIHPITKDIFYVGRTSIGLEFRLRQHIYSSRYKKTPNAVYIDVLLSSGIIPIIELIKETTRKDDEDDYILEYSKIYNLKNVSQIPKPKKHKVLISPLENKSIWNISKIQNKMKERPKNGVLNRFFDGDVHAINYDQKLNLLEIFEEHKIRIINYLLDAKEKIKKTA